LRGALPIHPLWITSNTLLTGSEPPSMHLKNPVFDRSDMGGIISSNRIGKALIIEDDEGMRSLLEDFFREEGFETDSVGEAAFALKKIVTNSFDLIITDVRMPDFSGLDILPELRRFQPKTPIIVITAFGSEEIHQKALLRGADAYLEKPVRLLKLRILIQSLVGSKDK
jgi:DNA-binding response OmpR family regulator